MNHLSDIGISKYELRAFQRRIGCISAMFTVYHPKDWRFGTQNLNVPSILKKFRYWDETHQWNFSALVFSDLCSNFLLPPSKGTASPYEVENASPWGEYTVDNFSHSNKYTHGITYLTCQKLISPCYLKIPFLGIYFTAQTLWRTAPGMRGATCIQKLFRHRWNASDTALESPEFILYNSNITYR